MRARARGKWHLHKEPNCLPRQTFAGPRESVTRHYSHADYHVSGFFFLFFFPSGGDFFFFLACRIAMSSPARRSRRSVPLEPIPRTGYHMGTHAQVLTFVSVRPGMRPICGLSHDWGDGEVLGARFAVGSLPSRDAPRDRRDRRRPPETPTTPSARRVPLVRICENVYRPPPADYL